MDTKEKKGIDRLDQWCNDLLSVHHNSSILPHSNTLTTSSSTKSRVLKISLLIYTTLCILFTFGHLSSRLFTMEFVTMTRGMQEWQLERTYDSDVPYSLLSDMSNGYLMSKLLQRGHYDSLQHIQPFWKKATETPNADNVTIIAATTPSTWKDLVELTNQWKGPISTTLHISSSEKEAVLLDIEKEYKTNPRLARQVDIHLIETKDGANKMTSILLSITAERNIARIYARSNYVTDIPLNSIIASNIHDTLVNQRKTLYPLLNQGDILVIPKFQYNTNVTSIVPQNKEDLFDKFSLDQEQTDLDRWKQAKKVYAVSSYTIDYEPITIQSKTIQPWCSERFVNKKSACLLSSYLAGSTLYVLPNDFIVQKPGSQDTEVSDLDRVIEKRLYSKFYWEQCVYHGRQLDAMGLWSSAQSEHIRQQCSRVIQNWGKGLIGKPE